MSFASGPKNVKEILNNFLKRRPNLKKQLTSVLVVEAAKKVFQEDFGDLSDWEVKNFRKGVLHLKVYNTLAAAYLKMNEQKILEKINRELGKKIVKKIGFWK